MVGIDNIFSPEDLLHYAEILLKESKLREGTVQQCSNNYGWLTARHIQNKNIKAYKELETLKPIIQKMSTENCAKIAVKLDDLAGGIESTAVILSTLKQLLIEQYSIQLMDKNVNKAKERGLKKARVNSVHPVLIPDGRQLMVSFILQC